MFRNQFFPGPTPPGFYDEPTVKPVTDGQDAIYPIPPGKYLLNYVIDVDNDADMVLFRSLFIEGPQQGQALDLLMQLRDAYGNYITDGFVPLSLYAIGAGSTPTDGGSGRTKVFEPELPCPPNSRIIADFYNPGMSREGGFTGPNLIYFSGSVTPPYAFATQAKNGGYYGPFESGTNLFVLLRGSESGNEFFSIWQKPVATPNAAWTQSASPPGGPTDYFLSGGMANGAVNFDGSKIWILAETNPGPPGKQLMYFDCGSQTWSTVGGTLDTSDVQTGVSQQLCVMPDGTALYFCVGGPGPPFNMGFKRMSSGGAWGSFVLLHTITSGFANPCVVGAVNAGGTTAHVLFIDAPLASPFNLNYVKVFADNSLGAEQIAVTGSGNNVGFNWNVGGDFTGACVAVFGGRLFCQSTDLNTVDGAIVSSALTDSPGNPTWQNFPNVLMCPAAANTTVKQGFFTELNGSILLLAHFNLFDGAGNCTSSALYSSAWDGVGSWAVQTKIFDTIDHQPTNPGGGVLCGPTNAYNTDGGDYTWFWSATGLSNKSLAVYLVFGFSVPPGGCSSFHQNYLSYYYEISQGGGVTLYIPFMEFRGVKRYKVKTCKPSSSASRRKRVSS